MRTFSNAVQTVINSDKIKFVFLIKLEFNSNYYLCSYHRELEYNNDVYLANSGLFEFDSPKFSSVIDRESYKIVIADILDEMSDEFRANVVGKPIQVFVALLDANDQPLLDVEDVLSVYSGYVDSPAITNDFEQKLAVIEGTSPMSDLDLVKVFTASKDGMDQVDNTDTSFDEIYENKSVSIKWGKI